MDYNQEDLFDYELVSAVHLDANASKNANAASAIGFSKHTIRATIVDCITFYSSEFSCEISGGFVGGGSVNSSPRASASLRRCSHSAILR